MNGFGLQRVGGTLKVGVSQEGVHSGMASGVIPSSFRIARNLLSRLEDEETGEIIPDWLHTDLSKQLYSDAGEIVDVLGDAIVTDFPFLEGVQPQHSDLVEALLAQNWKPTLSITGADGLPSLANAGNVLRTHTSLKVSVRIPPGVESEPASEKLKQLFEDNPPFGANVVFDLDAAANGFSAPPFLRQKLNAVLRRWHYSIPCDDAGILSRCPVPCYWLCRSRK